MLLPCFSPGTLTVTEAFLGSLRCSIRTPWNESPVIHEILPSTMVLHLGSFLSGLPVITRRYCQCVSPHHIYFWAIIKPLHQAVVKFVQIILKSKFCLWTQGYSNEQAMEPLVRTVVWFFWGLFSIYPFPHTRPCPSHWAQSMKSPWLTCSLISSYYPLPRTFN